MDEGAGPTPDPYSLCIMLRGYGAQKRLKGATLIWQCAAPPPTAPPPVSLAAHAPARPRQCDAPCCDRPTARPAIPRSLLPLPSRP
eukprot:2801315-Prymnesium_polylepis.1